MNKENVMSFVITSGDNGERMFSFCPTKQDFTREVVEAAKKKDKHIMVVTNKTVVNGSHSSFRHAKCK